VKFPLISISLLFSRVVRAGEGSCCESASN
jgi:hypothetical protein